MSALLLIYALGALVVAIFIALLFVFFGRAAPTNPRDARAEPHSAAPAEPAREPTPISADELLVFITNKSPVLILDVRTTGEYDSGHIPGALNIEHTELYSEASRLESYKDRPIVVHCEHGTRAYQAEMLLIDKGYPDIRHLEGDMAEWRSRGLQTETTPRNT